jgi:hypothetical protein
MQEQLPNVYLMTSVSLAIAIAVTVVAMELSMKYSSS